jgi:hypothetical protein
MGSVCSTYDDNESSSSRHRSAPCRHRRAQRALKTAQLHVTNALVTAPSAVPPPHRQREEALRSSFSDLEGEETSLQQVQTPQQQQQAVGGLIVGRPGRRQHQQVNNPFLASSSSFGGEATSDELSPRSTMRTSTATGTMLSMGFDPPILRSPRSRGGRPHRQSAGADSFAASRTDLLASIGAVDDVGNCLLRTAPQTNSAAQAPMTCAFDDETTSLDAFFARCTPELFKGGIAATSDRKPLSPSCASAVSQTRDGGVVSLLHDPSGSLKSDAFGGGGCQRSCTASSLWSCAAPGDTLGQHDNGHFGLPTFSTR